MRPTGVHCLAGRTAADFDVARGACDCHVHVFGEARTFPFAADRTAGAAALVIGAAGYALIRNMSRPHRGPQRRCITAYDDSHFRRG